MEIITKQLKKYAQGAYSSIKQYVQNATHLQVNVVDQFKTNWTKVILDRSRVCHTLKSGKILGYRVVCGIGDKKGIIGLGTANARVFSDAYLKAFKNAKKNLIILHNVGDIYTIKRFASCKKGATTVEVRPSESQHSYSKKGAAYCALSNLQKCSINLKKRKNTSLYNYYTALHSAVGNACI